MRRIIAVRPRELKRGMIVLAYFREERHRATHMAAARVAERNTKYGLGRVATLRQDEVSVWVRLERGQARGGRYLLDGWFLVAAERMEEPSLS